MKYFLNQHPIKTYYKPLAHCKTILPEIIEDLLGFSSFIVHFDVKFKKV
jgi:hypothetical protein